jgi:hypothetical protein
MINNPAQQAPYRHLSSSEESKRFPSSRLAHRRCGPASAGLALPAPVRQRCTWPTSARPAQPGLDWPVLPAADRAGLHRPGPLSRDDADRAATHRSCSVPLSLRPLRAAGLPTPGPARGTPAPSSAQPGLPHPSPARQDSRTRSSTPGLLHPVQHARNQRALRLDASRTQCHRAWRRQARFSPERRCRI